MQPTAAQPLLLTLAHRELRLHITQVRLLGRLRIEAGELRLADCSVEGEGDTSHSTDAQRALSIVGGSAILTRTRMRGHSGGAIGVWAATVVLLGCSIQESRALVGGAMHVGQGSMVEVASSLFVDNEATESGGALQVDGGQLHMLNETVFERNSAPPGGGSSINLGAEGTLRYTLPAPPGRWLFIPRGTVFQLEPGAVESDFPYPCPAGVVGGTSVKEQSSPQCSRPCDSGRLCPPATTVPQPCPRGSFCPRATAISIPCAPGTYSSSDSLGSAAGCHICPLGHACALGAAEPEPCAAGRFGATPGQMNR
eukprot:7178749-Prymnesium_polylepis.2